MVSISCFYVHYNRNPVNFTFIRFENFVRVILNNRSVILTYKQLVTETQLFQIYKLSLLCTEDISTIQSEKRMIKGNMTEIYGIATKRNWKMMHFTDDYVFVELYKSFTKNPLNMNPPKRATSMKKVRKFLKLLDCKISDYMVEPDDIIEDFFINETEEIFEYFNNYISYGLRFNALLSITDTYGSDVMTTISEFL